MTTYIQKLITDRGYYKVTLPKKLVEDLKLQKKRVLEIWTTEDKIIHIRGYRAKKPKGSNIQRGRSKVNR